MNFGKKERKFDKIERNCEINNFSLKNNLQYSNKKKESFNLLEDFPELNSSNNGSGSTCISNHYMDFKEASLKETKVEENERFLPGWIYMKPSNIKDSNENISIIYGKKTKWEIEEEKKINIEDDSTVQMIKIMNILEKNNASFKKKFISIYGEEYYHSIYSMPHHYCIEDDENDYDIDDDVSYDNYEDETDTDNY